MLKLHWSLLLLISISLGLIGRGTIILSKITNLLSYLAKLDELRVAGRGRAIFGAKLNA